MKRYKRILAGVVFASLLASGFSGSYESIGGRLSLVNPVEAGERFSWGNPSGSNNQNEESSVEMNQEPERFQWRPDDETETVPEESSSVEEDMQEDLYADSEGVIAEESDSIASNSSTDASSLNTNKSKAEKANSGQIVEQTVDVNLYADERKQSVFEERNVKMTIEGLLPENCVIDAYPVSFSMEGMEVIEAWNVTILDPNGEVYEPGKNPVQVTISSDVIMNLPAGQIEIYHIVDEGEKKISASNSDESSTEKSVKWVRNSGNAQESENTSEDVLDASAELIPPENDESTSEEALEVSDEIGSYEPTETSEDVLDTSSELIPSENDESTSEEALEVSDEIGSYEPTENSSGIEESDDFAFTMDAVADDGTPLTLEPLETIEIRDMDNSITFEVKEFSGIAALRGTEQLLGAGSEVHNVAVDTGDFLEINLFNYTNLRNTVANKGNTYLNDNSVHQGINLSNPYDWNSLRDFRFYSYGIKKLHNQPYSINNYTGGHSGDEPDGYGTQYGNGSWSHYDYQNFPVPLQGIVQNDLYDTNGVKDADGYPVLTYGAWQNNGYMPKYNGYSDQASLAYLFTEEQGNINGRKGTYNGLNKLFYVDNGLYTYDSKEYYAYYNPEQGNRDFKLYTAPKDELRGFFPFDDFKITSVHPDGENNNYYEHHFGMTLTSKFFITPDGTVPYLDSAGNPSRDSNGALIKTDEKFTFTGDDDLWVFIDGKLVLDVGGVHQPVDGTIDFKNGEVTINNYSYQTNSSKSQGREFQHAVAKVGEYEQRVQGTLSLRDILGDDWNNPYVEHTMKVFYIERGSNDSNLKLQFNMPNPKQIDIGKIVTGDDASSYNNEDFRFQLYFSDLDSDTEVYDVFNPHQIKEALDLIETQTNPEKVIGYAKNAYLNRLELYIGTENASHEIVYGNKLTPTQISQLFDDDGTFKLKHGQHLKVGNLYQEQKFYVKECAEGDRFEVSVDNSVRTETDRGMVIDIPTTVFENRTIKRKIKVDKAWEGVDYADQPDSIIVSVKQKDYVNVHFSGSEYDSLGAPVRIPAGDSFSFELSEKPGQNVDWDGVKVYANGALLSPTVSEGVRTYSITSPATLEPVNIIVLVDSTITNYYSPTNYYTHQYNENPAEDVLTLNPIEHVLLHVNAIGEVYNPATEEYDTVNLDGIGGVYSVLKDGGDEFEIAVSQNAIDKGIGFVSLRSTGLFKTGTETELADSEDNLMSSGGYTLGALEENTTLTIKLKGGTTTTADELEHSLTSLLLTNANGVEIVEYSFPNSAVTLKEFTLNKLAEGTPWHRDIIDPNDLNEKMSHFYEYDIDEVYVVIGGQKKSLADIGYSKTISGPVRSEEPWDSDETKIGAHVLSYTVTNKLAPVDVELIKTSSTKLPQGDETYAYEILPNVEFELYEKTIKTVTEGGEEVERVVLTPVRLGIVSNNEGKIFLTDLKRGKTYFLKETQAAEGYYLPEDGWTITVGLDGKVTITGQDNYAATYDVTSGGEFPGSYQIKNVKMYELPATGGPGDYLFTIIGISISFAIVLMKLRERREERAA